MKTTLQEIKFDISFTPWTIDTYSTFTTDGLEEQVIENYNEQRSKKAKDITYDDIEWNFDHKGHVQALAECWEEKMNENILDDVILKVQLDGPAYSPSFYNFTTDNCSTIFLVDLEKLKKHIADMQEHYQEHRIESYDGFMCFMDEEERMLHYYLRFVSGANYDSWEYQNDVRDADGLGDGYEFMEHELMPRCPNCDEKLKEGFTTLCEDCQLKMKAKLK